ncbi:hypothetical protein H632_c3157p0 [Helicosporidium sp. ATCC 50920]|nr:hypothetical protein H632_c3157p0 [Helicosporidium sp. ATCC 50920]|eukprot:KDD72586.1 hypothetical protein H632_c3157p0 [Helicosporidium sp. ATCC 50920]
MPLAAPLASLPAQLAYPFPPPPRTELSPRERAVLEAVGLGDLARAEPRISSAGALSPGELQRLAFARCLLRRPAVDLALLDEPTSAVGVQAACQLFGLLRAARVTYLSVGQDCEHLRRVHDSHLRFSGREGGWEIEELP